MTKAEKIVQEMLGGDDPVKECPLCAKEQGRQPRSDASHGYCPRHMKEVFGKRLSSKTLDQAAEKSQF